MVFSGTDISDDDVELKKMEDIDQSCLPKEDTSYKVLTESMREYIDCIHKELFMTPDYSSIIKLKMEYFFKTTNRTMELTKYKLNVPLKILLAHSDCEDSTVNNLLHSNSNYKSCICINSIIAA